MNPINSDIQQIEVDIDKAKKAVELRDALRRLSKNKDFQLLIEDNYFVQEASRLVLMKAVEQMENPESQARLDNQINAIGHLRQYFIFIEGWGTNQEAALEEHYNTLEELRDEEDEVIN